MGKILVLLDGPISSSLCLVLGRVWLFATPWTVACQAPLSMQISQARILEWVSISFTRGSSDPGIEPASLESPALAGGLFTTSATWEVPPSPEGPEMPEYCSKWSRKSLSCVWLFATPWTYSPWNSPGQNTGVGSLSLLQGIFLIQRSNPGIEPRDWTRVTHIAGRFFTSWATGKAQEY